MFEQLNSIRMPECVMLKNQSRGEADLSEPAGVGLSSGDGADLRMQDELSESMSKEVGQGAKEIDQYMDEAAVQKEYDQCRETGNDDMPDCDEADENMDDQGLPDGDEETGDIDSQRKVKKPDVLEDQKLTKDDDLEANELRHQSLTSSGATIRINSPNIEAQAEAEKSCRAHNGLATATSRSQMLSL